MHDRSIGFILLDNFIIVYSYGINAPVGDLVLSPFWRGRIAV